MNDPAKAKLRIKKVPLAVKQRIEVGFKNCSIAFNRLVQFRRVLAAKRLEVKRNILHLPSFTFLYYGHVRFSAM